MLVLLKLCSTSGERPDATESWCDHKTKQHPKLHCGGRSSPTQLGVQSTNTAAGAGGAAGTQHWQGRGGQESKVWMSIYIVLSLQRLKNNNFFAFWSLHLGSSKDAALGLHKRLQVDTSLAGCTHYSQDTTQHGDRMRKGRWHPAGVEKKIIKGSLAKKKKQTAQGASGTRNMKRARWDKSRSVFQGTQALSEELWNIVCSLGPSFWER